MVYDGLQPAVDHGQPVPTVGYWIVRDGQVVGYPYGTVRGPYIPLYIPYLQSVVPTVGLDMPN